MAYMLLTGATGLLGGYILRDALRQELPVAVLVRATASLSARRRIDAVLAPWETRRALPRPVVLEGDLSEPGLALSNKDCAWLKAHCDRVLHSAASISFYRDERTGEPYRTNVDGTRHLLELCHDLNLAEFHHVSTAYVCGRRHGRVFEPELEVGQEFGNDYERSKVAAEALVQSAHLGKPPTIYRPSIIVGDSETGYTTTFHGFYTPVQLAWCLAKAGLLNEGLEDLFLAQLGLSGSERKNIVPVDWVSRVILRIALDPQSHGRTYHLTSDQPPTAADLAAAISDALRSRPAGSADRSGGPDLPAQLMEADFRRHMDVYRAYFRDHPEFDTTNLRSAAPATPCPAVDRAMLARTGKFALDANFGWPRSMPPKPPADLPTLLAELPASVAPTGRACVLEVTGCGGGTWSLDLEASEPMLLHEGQAARPAARIRLRSDVFAALQQCRLRLGDVLQSGRVVVMASPDDAEMAVALLERLIDPNRSSSPLATGAFAAPELSGHPV